MSSFTVFLKVSGGEKLSLDVTPKQTIAELKAAVAGRCDIPAENQRLIYKGQVLKDEKTVEDYGEPEPFGDMGPCCMSFLSFEESFAEADVSHRIAALAADHVLHLVKGRSPGAARCDQRVCNAGYYFYGYSELTDRPRPC